MNIYGRALVRALLLIDEYMYVVLLGHRLVMQTGINPIVTWKTRHRRNIFMRGTYYCAHGKQL